MNELYAILAGFGWGFAITLVICWLIGAKCRKKRHEADITDFIGDKSIEKPLSKPNGKAVFLSDFTETELKEYQKMELQGWRKLYDKLRKLV
jgi:hypothetical protein